MGKVLKYTFIGLLLLFAGGFLVTSLMIDSYVKSSIEEVGTELTGTVVTVEGVSLSPFTGQGTITGFRIANPDGFDQEDAIRIEQFSMDVDLFTLLSDVVVINEVRMSNASVYVEQQLPDNNLREIMRHFNEAADSGSGSFGELVIEYFLLEGGSVELYTDIGGDYSARVEMSTIEIRDPGSGGGEEFAEQVIQEIARQVVEQALQAALRSGTEQLRDAIENIFQ